MTDSQKKFYITTPIYYVNDKPHVGHIYTTVVADVLARYRRSKGDEVFFLTGTDENAQKSVEAANKAGKDIKDYTDELAGIWRETFLKLNFSFDRFIRTTSPEHRKAVEEFYSLVQAKGDIYQADYEGYYCKGCEGFVTESELTDDGYCPFHLTKPELIKEKNYFFKASKYKQELLDHIEKHPEFIQPMSRRNEVVNYIKEHFVDFSISRQSVKWGIPLPTDPTQVIYVWFDALLGYFSGIGFGQDDVKFDKFWPADVQLVGKDIIKFHCAYWPTMLLSAGYELPKTIYANGFFTSEGKKISKSLGNAIDPLELAKEYTFDAIRYFLLREIPFGDDGDFSTSRLKERYNSDLANGLGNLVQRTLNMISQYADGKIDQENTSNLPVKFDKVDELIDKFKFDQALQEIWRGITWANKFIEDEKPWELYKNNDQDKLASVLGQLYAIIKEVNKHIEPFLPETSEKINKLLTASKIVPPEVPLFPRKL